MSSNHGRSKAVAADYDWIEDEDLFEAYCLTLVRGITPQEFMDRIGAQITFDALRFGTRFSEISFEHWDAPSAGETLFIGAATVAGDGGDWTLALEANGYLGTVTELMVPMSVGTRLVSHYYSCGNGNNHFHWIEDGDVRLSFEPFGAPDRDGSTPDALLEDMKQIGFDLDWDDEDRDPTLTAAFALAERLTGVRVTNDMLYGTDFLCGTARDTRS